MTATITRAGSPASRSFGAARDRGSAPCRSQRRARRHHPARAGPCCGRRCRATAGRAAARPTWAARHRGDQAPLPVGGVARRGTAGCRRPGTRLRRGRRLDDLGARRAPLVRRLDRRPGRRHAPRPRCRCWPRSSWSIRGSCPSCAPRAPMPCCCSPRCIRLPDSLDWSDAPSTWGWSRSSRSTTRGSWMPR